MKGVENLNLSSSLLLYSTLHLYANKVINNFWCITLLLSIFTCKTELFKQIWAPEVFLAPTKFSRVSQHFSVSLDPKVSHVGTHGKDEKKKVATASPLAANEWSEGRRDESELELTPAKPPASQVRVVFTGKSCCSCYTELITVLLRWCLVLFCLPFLLLVSLTLDGDRYPTRGALFLRN